MKERDEIQNYRKSRQSFFWNNRWFWTIVLFVIATVLSAAKPVVLPDGGAVTYFSLFFLWMITFFFGPKYGLWVSVLFGVAKLWITWVTGEHINFMPVAIILEYPVACGVFALGGLLPAKKRISHGIRREPGKLRAGYLLGVLCMGVCYVISAVLFYPPDRAGFWANLLYCMKYDMSYLAIEAGVTILILCIPQIPEAIYYLKHVATSVPEDPTLKYF